MNMTCYLVDDEPHTMELLALYIKQTPGLELIGIEDKPEVALQKIQDNELMPDITFLDIGMPGLSGLELAGMIKDKTTIIIVTAFRQYGPEAYSLDTLDYILKPFTYERFMQSIEKAKEKRMAQAGSLPYCFIPGDRKGVKIKLLKTDIQYIKASANYLRIITGTKSYMTYLSFTDMLLILSDSRFIRVHKSYIVNVEKINTIDSVSVYMENGAMIPIGPSYKEAFLRRIL